MMKVTLQLSVCFTLFLMASCDDTNPTVLTKSGPVQGIISKNDKGVVYKFLKVPFAKPPVGNLRFKKPEPVEPWDDVIDATQHPPSCEQSLAEFKHYLPTLEHSEDCLYLSVYVPNDLSSAYKKSVMVWIHGGGYHLGQASMYDGSPLATTGDVIVVTINYRLNVFGFLTTWDSAALGNYGIWDQIMALQWIHNNIESFGGNPNSVTIFGQSAGGLSASLLSLIPSNKGLFQRVIPQSGTANSPFAYNENYRSHLKTLIDHEDVGCNDKPDDSHYIVDCLRQVPAENFINVTGQILMEGAMYSSVLPFSPRIDNELFIVEPRKILKDPSNPSYQFMRSLDQMVGFTDAEGAALVMYAGTMSPDEPFNGTEGIPTKFLCRTLFPSWVKSWYDDVSEVTDAICNIYSIENGDTTNKIEQAKIGMDSNSDFMLIAPAVAVLNAHSKNNKLGTTYQYVFSRPFRQGFSLSLPDWFEGAPHGFEIPYLFDLDYFALKNNFTLEDTDYGLADTIQKYWTNFAKTGNPNSDSLPVWQPYTEEKMEFINLNRQTKLDMASDGFRKRMNFWINDIPNIMERAHAKKHQEL